MVPRPPQEASFATDVNKYYENDELLRPQDSIVTRPVFTPDGTLLFEAEKTQSEAKLDRLIDSLGSLISLLNSTKEQGNTADAQCLGTKLKHKRMGTF